MASRPTRFDPDQMNTHLVGTPGRPVPDYDEAGPGAYNPAREEILIFNADVTLIRRRGGLYRFDPATGERELLRSVAATPLGTYQHPELLAIDPTGHFVFLARRSTARGPSTVSLAVFDLHRRRYQTQRQGPRLPGAQGHCRG